MARMMRNPRRSETGATLENHLENEWCKKVGCVPVELGYVESKEREVYKEMQEERAKRVDTLMELVNEKY